MGARLHARVAPAIRQATLVNRLVSHARRPARRRSTQTLARRGLARTLHSRRPLRELDRGFGRRLPGELIRQQRGAFAGRPGTCIAG